MQEMCPNYLIELGKQKIKGPKAYGMGKEPVWDDFTSVNHTLQYSEIDRSSSVKISFLSESDLICSVSIPISTLIEKSGVGHWYDTQRAGSPSGCFKMRVYHKEEKQESQNGTPDHQAIAGAYKPHGTGIYGQANAQAHKSDSVPVTQP